MAKPVKWDLIADPTRFNRGFREAERTSGRFQQHMRRQERSTVRFGTTLGNFGGIAVRAFGGATVAAGGLAAAGAVLGLKTAASLETAEVAFSRLLGSGKKARSFLGELKSFAARTPFELPGLVDASRALVGAGTAAKDVIPILTSLGDASGALGLDQERFGRVMIAVTQIMNRGKIQAEELNQITEAGIPVWTLLAKATGKPVPELQKLMQAGKLLAKDTLPLLFAQMKKDYGGGMIAQSKTLAGVWSTVKDTISLTLSDALQPLLPMLKTALPQAAAFFQRSIKGIAGFFRNDLAPELGRVRIAWNDNRASILGFATSLETAEAGMLTSKDAAAGLADTLERLINLGGDAAEFGDRIAEVLNNWAAHAQGVDVRSDSVIDTVSTLFGLRAPPEVVDWFQRVSGEAEKTATATRHAATAAQDHAGALRNEKTALQALQGVLDDEKTSEIDLRQAKLNVSTAQRRLNDLKRDGKTRSFEYKQAQLDLERAQIDLRHKTDDYRAAQKLANAATRGAMRSSQEATGAHRAFKDAAARAGSAAWLMGGKIKDGLLRIPKGRVIRVTATFGFKTPPKVSVHDIVGGLASGGRITQGSGPTADDVLARLSKGETVVPAVDSARPEFRAWAGERGIPGFARGGVALDASFPSVAPLLRSFGGFERVIDRIIGRLAGKWDRLAERLGGNPAIQAFIRSTDPLPYRWGAAGPGAYDCSGLVSAVYGKHTGRGGGSGQRYFTTASISATGGLKPGLGGVLNIGVTPSQGHMAGTYGGLGFEARSTRSGIIIGPGARDPASFARHFHMARGGRVDRELVELFARLAGADIGGDAGRLRIAGKVFDRGGWLMPGATLAVNRTGRPERVGGMRLSRADADMLADAMVRALERYGLRVGVDDVHTALLAKKRRQGRVALGLD